ncbi:kinase-like protein [Armillaria solidipes]|uniref:Kinase-like protein n=1 Tax=Armillaria solidipes TaxID=1076256 RepID=A0A2H3B0E7_9AGAR|nr:kinase-like protein [Armillaria solidipes]
MDCRLIVELNSQEDDTTAPSINSFSSEETVVDGLDYQQLDLLEPHRASTPPLSPPIYNPPRHPTSIFSFPTPTAYSAPPNPTKPDVIQLEINGEMQSNASDVTVQFLAELRVYTTVMRHRNICAFLGALENVGMVLEYIDGLTLYDVVTARPELTREAKIDFHDQLLDGLTHLHPFGLSHGDLSLLNHCWVNVQATVPANTVKLLDFGRSVSADSIYKSPDDEPIDPFAYLIRRQSSQTTIHSSRKIEQIHPGTRPFCAPEILRGECQDTLLADAYSFGIILVCLDRCKKDEEKDSLPQPLSYAPATLMPTTAPYLATGCLTRTLMLKGSGPTPFCLAVLAASFLPTCSQSSTERRR